MNVLCEKIPAKPVRLKRRVVWQYNTRNDHQTKPLYVPGAGGKRRALVNRPYPRGRFELAKNACLSGVYDGIVSVPGEGIFGIDLDRATDGMVQQASSPGSCAEWSPSGRGIHVIGPSRPALKGRKKGSVELYREGSSFTVTGSRCPGVCRIFGKFPRIG